MLGKDRERLATVTALLDRESVRYTHDSTEEAPPLSAYENEPADSGVRTIDVPPKQTPPTLFDATKAPIGIATFDETQCLPDPIVRDYLPSDVGAFVGQGGLSKTTLQIWEAVHIILGRPLYGREVVRPGKVLFVSGEDPTRRTRFRLRMICESMRLSRAEHECIAESLLVEDLTGQGVRLVAVDGSGNLSQTSAVAALVDAYQDQSVSLVNIDPLVYFGPGERFVNDAEAAMAQAAHRISLGLDCAVRYTQHTGKANAREGRSDQYAGRGGSALPDGMRFVQVLNRHDKRTEGVPDAFSEEDIARGRVLALSVPKITDAAPILQPIWIKRENWAFTHVTGSRTDDQLIESRQLRDLVDFVQAELVRGVYHSKRTLEDSKDSLGLKRERLRSLINIAMSTGMLIEQSLPKDKQHGGRKTYLTRGIAS